MSLRLAWMLALLGMLSGASDGRTGNARYAQQNYAAAEAAYRAGLRATDDTTGAVYAALQHNLGLALHQQQKHREALQAFRAGARAAASDAEAARAYYNAGNTSVTMGALQTALRLYRQALLRMPTMDAARHNYEVLKQELARRQKQRRTPASAIEPSAYARQLKQQADRLVARQQYDAAYALLSEGLRQDSTVRAYGDFMRRVQDIVEINVRHP
ncbi:tetratricopeptide repeat protein [Salisaeta longa]|uniref:hypothetical protein n=1 Tax=Salisaeta longa TaxID=503170 RepID=UPI0003B773C8|nr:hypothetical protein [Salisaeta longa]